MTSDAAGAARDRGHGPAQGLRRARGGPRHRLPRWRAARSSGCSAPTAPARRRRWRSSRATARAAAGDVSVLGLDPGERPAALRERVGIVLQSCGFYPHLTVREAVEHWASLYPAPREPAEVVALVGLGGGGGPAHAHAVGRPAAAARPGAGAGRRSRARVPRRADHRLRPRRRGAAAWETIRSLRDLGKTVLLTTHYLDEAQALADRVAIVKDGAILAEGSPGRAGGRRRRATACATGWPAARSSSARPTTRRRCCTSSPARRSRAASGSRT